MLCSSTDVLIYVTDFNDEVPTFYHTLYKADITMNYTAGTVIMQPVAIDEDSAEFSELTYTLSVSYIIYLYSYFCSRIMYMNVCVRVCYMYFTTVDQEVSSEM